MFHCIKDDIFILICACMKYSLKIISFEHTSVTLALIPLTYFRMQLSPWENHLCHQ